MPNPSSSQRSTEERAAKKPSTHPSGFPPGVILAAAAGLASAKRHSYAVCYQTYLAEARALPASQVVVFRGNARVALDNVRFGMDNVCGDPARIAHHLPELPLHKAMSAADVARAVVYARTMVDPKPPSTGEIQRRVASIKELRADMLVFSARLVRTNVLAPEQGVTATEREGVPGMARDAVRLHRMFTAHADALQGLHPFTAKEIAQLGADGEWLLEALKPGTARTRTPSRAGTAAEDCNRLGMLLVERHALLRKVAYYFHGDGFDTVVPPLLSATRTAVAEEDPAAIAPPATAPNP